MLRLSSLSTEYVKVPVSIKVNGAVVNPTSYVVKMAFKTSGEPIEADWKTASWETAGTTYYVRCLVGPSGDVTLADGSYDIWLRITGAPEIPVRTIGRLIVT